LNNRQLLTHLENHGVAEGRQFSPLVDLNFYRTNSSDLKNYTNDSLFNHLKYYGIDEGRQFSPDFDSNYYRSNNKDLANHNNKQLLQHYQNYGINEGRSASTYFSAGLYRSANADLAGLKGIQLLNHFKLHGINEGRTASFYFDFNYYRSNNKDLANYGNNQLFQHFERYGINEGRKASPYFDAGYYKLANPDLAGFKGIQLLNHYDKYGQYEGRQGATESAGNTLSTARKLTVGSSYSSVIEHVGLSNPNDYYRFDLAKTSNVNIQNFGFSKNISSRLLNSNGQLVKSLNSQQYNSDKSTAGTATNSISLDPGTYYLNIQPQAGNTAYQFYINATTPQPPSEMPMSLANQLFVSREMARLNELMGSMAMDRGLAMKSLV